MRISEVAYSIQEENLWKIIFIMASKTSLDSSSLPLYRRLK
jgi:hypothetical protein